MKLLYFAPHPIAPVDTGARLRDYQLARHLGARSSVTFIEMRNRSEEQPIFSKTSNLANVVTLDKQPTYTPSKILRGLAGPAPVTLLNCWSVHSASRLARLLAFSQFDTIQMEGVHLMKYLPLLHDAPGNPAIVVDWHNIESEIMWRYARTTSNWAKKIVATRTATLIERAEDRLLEACATHTVTSERERQKLLARNPGANIQVIPNGVDASYYSPKVGAGPAGQSRSKSTILFVGSMDYHANIDAVTWFARNGVAGNRADASRPAIHDRRPRPGRQKCARWRRTGSTSPGRSMMFVPTTHPPSRQLYRFGPAAAHGSRSWKRWPPGVPSYPPDWAPKASTRQNDIHFCLLIARREIAAAVIGLFLRMKPHSSVASRKRTGVQGYDWSVIGERLFAIHEDLAESRARGAPRRVS